MCGKGALALLLFLPAFSGASGFSHPWASYQDLSQPSFLQTATGGDGAQDQKSLQQKVYSIRYYSSWMTVYSMLLWMTSVPLQQKIDKALGTDTQEKLVAKLQNDRKAAKYYSFYLFYLGKWYENLHRLSVHNRPQGGPADPTKGEAESKSLAMLEIASSTPVSQGTSTHHKKHHYLSQWMVEDLNKPVGFEAHRHLAADLERDGDKKPEYPPAVKSKPSEPLPMFDKYFASIRPWLQWAEWFRHMDANCEYFHTLMIVYITWAKYLKAMAMGDKLSKEAKQKCWDEVVEVRNEWFVSYGFATFQHATADQWVDGHIEKYEKLKPQNYEGVFNQGYGPVNYGPFWGWHKLSKRPSP